MFIILKSKIFHIVVLLLLTIISTSLLTNASREYNESKIVSSFKDKLEVVKYSNIDKEVLYSRYNIIKLIYKDKEIVSSPDAYFITFYFIRDGFDQSKVNNYLGYFVYDQSFEGEYEIVYIQRLSSNDLIDRNINNLCYILTFSLFFIAAAMYVFIDNKNLKFNYKVSQLISASVSNEPTEAFASIENYVRLAKLFEKCISSSSEGLIIFKDHEAIFHNKMADKFVMNCKITDDHIMELSKKISTGIIKEEYKKGSNTYFIETKKLEVRKDVYYAMYIIDETDKIEFDNKKVNFFNQAGHELRTPLTNLSAYVDLLCNCELSLEDKEEMMEDGIAECRKLDVLITSILDISKRLDKDDLYSKVNLKELIEEALESYKFNKMKIQFDVIGDCYLICNRVKVLSLVKNLLKNAFFHNIEGGFVNIKLKEEVGLFDLEITNSSKEIKDYEVSKVFEPFFKCESNELDTGTGIGLTICKYICETHNYDIDFSYDNGVVKVVTKLYLKSLGRYMKK